YEKANKILDAAAFSGMPANQSARQQPRGRAPVPQASEGDGDWTPDGGTVPHLGGGAGGAAAGHDGPGGGYDAGSGDSAPAPYSEGRSGQGGGVSSGGEAAATGRVRDQVVAEALAAGRPLRYRDLVRDQLRAWRARDTDQEPAIADSKGGMVAPDALSGAGHVLGTADLLNLASLLQGDDPEPFEKVLAGEDGRPLADVIRHALLSGVRQIGFDPANTHFSGDEEDAIDLVGILFQSLFDANDLVGDARQLYGKLVVPYLKVALTDDSLFNRRSHPARRLLDAVTEACDGNEGKTPQDQETLNQAGHAVDRVVGEYGEDQAIFELAAAELRDHLDQQRRRAELTEKRAAEAIHGRERLQQARRSAADLVASRLSGRPL